MKKELFLIGVVVVFASVLFVGQVAALEYKGAMGYLHIYNNLSDCNGASYYPPYHTGHTIQYSTNSGTTWVDATTTGFYGYFGFEPAIDFVGTMWVRAKPQCGGIGGHNDDPCVDHYEFSYNKNACCLYDLGEIHSYDCGD